jgi:hypothetical protein
MILQSFWQSLENSGLAQSIASGEWAFPIIETFHVIAITTVVGTIAIMDLKLLGLTSPKWTMISVEKDTLKLTWIAFVFAVITGVLMFISKATTYMVNPYFIWKMFLILAAGINMGIFHRGVWKSVNQWNSGAVAIPAGAKIAASLSLAFWVIVVFCGRFIGFTLGVYVPNF